MCERDHRAWGLNTLTGVMGQWTDSVPALYLSGQVKFETTIASCPDIRLRQLGDQEVDIVSVVRPIVKYAVQIRTPADAGYELEKAVWIASHGRPGPVRLDIPIDVQGAVTTESEQRHFVPQPALPRVDSKLVKEALARIDDARRPVLVAGHGVRLAGGVAELRLLVERLGIPLLTTFNGMDLVEDDFPFHVGHIGTLGSRGGNFALQNADLVLFIGTRNNIRQVSYNWTNFAQRAYKIGVDIAEKSSASPQSRLTRQLWRMQRTFSSPPWRNNRQYNAKVDINGLNGVLSEKGNTPAYLRAIVSDRTVYILTSLSRGSLSSCPNPAS